MVKAIAFEAYERKGMYCADGPDISSMDVNGETTKVEDSLLVIRTKDLQPPTDDDLLGAYKFLNSLGFFDYEAFRENYKPVNVELTDEQVNVVRERNEW